MSNCALIPLSEGHLLLDPATGHLSVAFTSIALCIIVIIITFVGGLWAVLMTDVLQFVILTVSVVFVVPLILIKAGGVDGFLDKAPDSFLAPVAAVVASPEPRAAIPEVAKGDKAILLANAVPPKLPKTGAKKGRKASGYPVSGFTVNGVKLANPSTSAGLTCIKVVSP